MDKYYIVSVFKWWWAVTISIFIAGIQALLYFRTASTIFLWIGAGSLVVGIFIAQYIVFRKKSTAFEKLKKQLITAEKKDEILGKLAKLRERGVSLRNFGIARRTETDVETWIEDVKKWQHEVYEKINELSPSESILFQTMDWVTFPNFPNAVNGDHDMYLRILSMRTQKLLELVQRYSVENLYRQFKFEN